MFAYLDQGYETVDLSIEGAAMQGRPARFLVLQRQVSTLTLQQPLQQDFLSQRGCQVKGGATKSIPQRGPIVAV